MSEELERVRKMVASTMHIGLDDATPNSPEDPDRESWPVRVQEWADWIHEQYVAALAGELSDNEAAYESMRRSIVKVAAERDRFREALAVPVADLRLAIADPGAFLARGNVDASGKSDYSESITSWSARAVAELLRRRAEGES